MGIAQYRLGNYVAAVVPLRQAALAEPSNPTALMWLGMSQLAAGEASLAAVSLEKASKLKPGDVDVLYHLGRAYMQLSKQTYERLYESDPSSWRVHQVLATSFQEADRLEDAAEECEQAIAARPNEPGLHQQLGDIYWAAHHLEQAETEFRKELENDNQNYTAMYKLAVVEIDRAKPESAEKLLGVFLRAHGDSREAHYQMGRAEAQLGESESAIHDFTAVVTGTGAADSEIVQQSYYQLSQLYRRTKRAEEAKVALESFLRMKEQTDAQQEKRLEDKLKRSSSNQQQQ